MAGKKQKQEGVGAWVAIVILFAAGAGGRRIRRDCRQDQKGRAQRHEVPGGEEV